MISKRELDIGTMIEKKEHGFSMAVFGRLLETISQNFQNIILIRNMG